MRTAPHLALLRHAARATTPILGEVVVVDPRLGRDDGTRTQTFGAQFALARGRTQGAVAAIPVECGGSGQGQVLGDTRHQILLEAGEPRLQRTAHRPATTRIADISYFWKGSADRCPKRLLSQLLETAFISYFPHYPLSAPRSPPPRLVRYARSNGALSSVRSVILKLPAWRCSMNDTSESPGGDTHPVCRAWVSGRAGPAWG